MGGWISGWMDKEYVGRWMGRWIAGWMDEQIDGWMDDGCVGG